MEEIIIDKNDIDINWFRLLEQSKSKENNYNHNKLEYVNRI